MRTSSILVALLVAPLAGCVEQVSRAKDAPQEIPKAEKTAPPPRKTTKPTDSDESDPILQSAQAFTSRIAAHEERIDAALTAISSDVRALSAKDRQFADLTAARLLDLVQMLRKSGERVIEQHPKTKAEIAALVKTTTSAAVNYRRAKELYREKAGLETDDLRDQYLGMADMCETLIDTNKERAQKYDAFAKDLDRAVAKVERHVEFLRDYESFLNLNPGAAGGREREEFIETLNRFADQILKFGRTLTEFRDKVREGATSKALRAEHDRALAALKRAEPAPQMTPPDEPQVPVAPSATAERPEPRKQEPAGPQYVPVTVTRLQPVLVPVTHYSTCGRLLRRTTVSTCYEWRNQLVTETVYQPIVQ